MSTLIKHEYIWMSTLIKHEYSQVGLAGMDQVGLAVLMFNQCTHPDDMSYGAHVSDVVSDVEVIQIM